MEPNHSPQTLLQQIARIERMEPGKLCVIRQGPEGAYYNLQNREGGRSLTRYVPREEAELVAEHTANYQRFRHLVDRYAQLIVERTRAERAAGSKKKPRLPRPRTSSSPKRRRSQD